MKRVLKIWLADNTLTTDDKNDKVPVLDSAGKLELQDVIQRMLSEDTGLRKETLDHSVHLYNRVLLDLLLNGYSVNTGLFRAVAQPTGIVEGGQWDKEKNGIYVVFTQGKDLREAIDEASVEILGEKANVMYILDVVDKKSGRKDGSATAGHNLLVNGAMLKVVGDNEANGVSLTDGDGTVTKLDADQIVINNPSSLLLLLPAGLAAGEYTLTVTTQYASSGLLKAPRSAETTVWIGGKPDDDEEDDSGTPGGV